MPTNSSMICSETRYYGDLYSTSLFGLIGHIRTFEGRDQSVAAVATCGLVGTVKNL